MGDPVGFEFWFYLIYVSVSHSCQLRTINKKLKINPTTYIICWAFEISFFIEEDSKKKEDNRLEMEEYVGFVVEKGSAQWKDAMRWMKIMIKLDKK